LRGEEPICPCQREKRKFGKGGRDNVKIFQCHAIPEEAAGLAINRKADRIKGKTWRVLWAKGKEVLQWVI